MKSHKCSKTGAPGTRQSTSKNPKKKNAPAKITSKNPKKKKKEDQKVKLEAVATLRKTWQILSSLCNLCFLFSC